MLNALKARELKQKLSSISVRTTRDSVQRIIGDGNKIKGAIKNLQNSLFQVPKNALQNWRNFVSDIHNKKSLDNLRAQQLKNTLGKIPTRVLKDSMQRTIGQGDLVKGALRRLQLCLDKKKRESFDRWNHFLDDIRQKKALDATRAQKLKNTLSSIQTRSIKDTVQRIIGQGSKVKGALRNLESTLSKVVPQALNIWKKFA